MNPNISPPENSPYLIDPGGDGRNLLMLNSAGPGIAMVPGGSFNVLLGVLHGPSNAVATVALENCDLECGGTVFRVGFEIIPDFTLSVIPEPGLVALVLAAFLPLGVLRTARRRAA